MPYLLRMIATSLTHHPDIASWSRARRETFREFFDTSAFVMGTPETIIKVLKKYQGRAVNQVLCFKQMDNLAHERIVDSINFFWTAGDSVFQIGARRAPGLDA